MIVYKYGYPNPEQSPDISPFVVKLETWLRLSGIPYETRTGMRREKVRGKLPVALIDGQLVPDSSAIIAYLSQHDARALRDGHLAPVERAQSLATKALFESHLYFIGLYLRWCVAENFTIYRPMLLDYARRSSPHWQRPLLPLVAPIILPFVRRSFANQAWQQGTGRHSHAEVERQGLEAWEAVTALLGEKQFLFGDRASTTDATAFAWIHTTIRHPFSSPLQRFVRDQPQLVAYHDRIWERYWGQ